MEFILQNTTHAPLSQHLPLTDSGRGLNPPPQHTSTLRQYSTPLHASLRPPFRLPPASLLLGWASFITRAGKVLTVHTYNCPNPIITNFVLAPFLSTKQTGSLLSAFPRALGHHLCYLGPTPGSFAYLLARSLPSLTTRSHLELHLQPPPVFWSVFRSSLTSFINNGAKKSVIARIKISPRSAVVDREGSCTLPDMDSNHEFL
ncbi:hypothetical protein E2C01_020731 [Portunus trituberculatus]|uniref:Uncharacterized protein n=1 Tax=Portunus trituberculatus TaxID=210409 RepID=A0A5B7E1D2_PORTR|nr:hypothetical protein [Portunus trituberculatus]